MGGESSARAGIEQDLSGTVAGRTGEITIAEFEHALIEKPEIAAGQLGGAPQGKNMPSADTGIELVGGEPAGETDDNIAGRSRRASGQQGRPVSEKVGGIIRPLERSGHPENTLIIDLDGRSGGPADDIAGEREGSDGLQASSVDGDGGNSVAEGGSGVHHELAAFDAGRPAVGISGGKFEDTLAGFHQAGREGAIVDLSGELEGRAGGSPRAAVNDIHGEILLQIEIAGKRDHLGGQRVAAQDARASAATTDGNITREFPRGSGNNQRGIGRPALRKDHGSGAEGSGLPGPHGALVDLQTTGEGVGGVTEHQRLRTGFDDSPVDDGRLDGRSGIDRIRANRGGGHMDGPRAPAEVERAGGPGRGAGAGSGDEHVARAG